MDRIFLDETKCPHNQGFFCTSVQEGDDVLATMACSLLCGYYMNFDPEHAGKIQEAKIPELYTLDSWKLNTPHFMYSQRRATRKLPPLSTAKY